MMTGEFHVSWVYLLCDPVNECRFDNSWNDKFAYNALDGPSARFTDTEVNFYSSRHY